MAVRPESGSNPYDRFRNRVFTVTEQTRAERMKEPAATYAKRWAAKEACSKALGTGRLAMGFTASVPAGIYGKAALETLGLWDGVQGQLAEVDNVRAALALVADSLAERAERPVLLHCRWLLPRHGGGPVGAVVHGAVSVTAGVTAGVTCHSI